jgi:hypothetical protein
MIANGLLPGKRECVCCHRPVRGMMRIGLACEPTPGDDELPVDEAVGCLLGLFMGSASEVVGSATAQMAKNETPDYSVVVPLPVCDACRPPLADSAALRQAIRQIAEYAALLDRYPDALIRRVS